jgi:hypothetical protein
MAGTNEDDYEPYPVFTKAPTRPCPECGKPLECKATACVNCGLDLSSGQKVVRTFEPINKEWEAGWPYPMRFKAFIVCQIVTAVTALIGLVRGELGTSFFAWIVLTALLAFVLGTYNRIKLTRTAKGKVQLTKTWRICFLERPAETIRWREHEGIVTGRSHEVSAMDWMMFLVLLPFFILPAIVWWWFIINPDKFHAALTKDRGFPETMLYQGLKQAQAEEIADVVSNATGLPWSRG